MGARIIWTFVAVAELGLLIIVLTITFAISSRTALVAGVALCFFGLFAVFTGRGFWRLRGRLKRRIRVCHCRVHSAHGLSAQFSGA